MRGIRSDFQHGSIEVSKDLPAHGITSPRYACAGIWSIYLPRHRLSSSYPTRVSKSSIVLSDHRFDRELLPSTTVKMSKKDPASVLDISKWPTAQKFVERCSEFLNEVEDL